MLSMATTLEHHARFHSNINCWGDSGTSGFGGPVTTQRCFVCGMELVKSPGVFKTIEEQEIEMLEMVKQAHEGEQS